MTDDTPAMSLDPAPPSPPDGEDEELEGHDHDHGSSAGAKPGYQTTEFWLTVVTTIAGLIASAGLGETVEKITALIISILPTIVYTFARKSVKQSADDVEITKIENGQTHS